MVMSDSDDSDDDHDGVGLIVPIQQHDVRRIVAGQVISDLASTVKELVDNGLDSGSKSIHIRLVNQGLDVIEVSDFGSGVPLESRPLLAMKHATSKIRSFEELYTDSNCDNGHTQFQQLGFRGEALFSLANISQNLVISTRTENDTMGQRMQFRRDGYLDPNATTDVARKVGTTVEVVKLFDALPVRRADLIKRIKGHRAKMLRILQAYAVLCVGVRFNLVDVSGVVGSRKCKTEVKMNTSQNSKTLRETVSQVFGSKFVSGLHPIRVDLTSILSPPNGTVLSSPSKGQQPEWRIEGLVSKAPTTEMNGKAARDIQFFSINGRPVELPKVSQVVSDAWRNFESDISKKRPACILRFFLPNSRFDINVAPDKREVLLSDASCVYDALRNALIRMWSEETEGVFIVNEVEATSNQSKSTSHVESPVTQQKLVEASKIDADDNVFNRSPVKRRKMQRRNAFVNHFNSNENTDTSSRNVFGHFAQIENMRKSLDLNYTKSNPTATTRSLKRSTRQDSESEDSSESPPSPRKEPKQSHGTPTISSTPSSLIEVQWNQTKLNFSPAQSHTQQLEIDAIESMQKDYQSLGNANRAASKRKINNTEPSKQKPKASSMGNLDNFALSTPATKVSPASVSSPHSPSTQKSESKANEESDNFQGTVMEAAPATASSPHSPVNSKSQHDRVDSEDQIDTNKVAIKPLPQGTIPHADSSSEEDDEYQHEGSPNQKDLVQMKSGEIFWPGFSTSSALKDFQSSRQLSMHRSNHVAMMKSERASNKGKLETEYEEEIGRESSKEKISLSKDEFLTMNILGQFNLGFILALGDDGQLWILDQHGCDEKYNFEKLCKETKIHEQKLISPLPLELSPSEENCVLENLDIFEKNGFRFSHDSTKPPRHRLSLTAVPHSGSGGDGRKAVQFGPQDVGALCAILGADGASSSNGYVAGSGTGADGGGKCGNNAVRRHAGTRSGSIIRLPKAVAMFASRACRSSIMIGESLSQRKMEEVIQKLNKLDHPWECAHGRPTIRHVRDLIEQLFDDENIEEIR